MGRLTPPGSTWLGEDARGRVVPTVFGSAVTLGFYAASALLSCGSPAAASTVLYTLHSPAEQEGGMFGWSVVAVDVTGDGISDVAVAAPGEASESHPQAGAVHVFDGSSGLLLRSVPSPAPQHLARFGFAVARIGDVDGDGRDDLMVGAPGEAEAGLDDAGCAYVLQGASGAVLFRVHSPEPEAAGYFGCAVASPGDVTGDNIPDMVVGALGEIPSSARSNVGRAYLFSGSDGALVRTLEAPVERADGRFGEVCAAAADVDQDGCLDIAFGMPAADDSCAGAVFILSSATGISLRTLRSPEGVAGGRFGSAVAGGRDLDGDGIEDLLVGAPGEAGHGQGYAFSGLTGASVGQFVPPVSENASFFARSVEFAGDVDGDGASDVLMGGLRTTPGAALIGVVDVLRSSGESLATLPAPQEVGTSYGWSVGAMGDVTGDAFGEIIIGAYGMPGESTEIDVGSAYVVDMSAGGITAAAGDRLLLEGLHPNPATDHVMVAIGMVCAGTVDLSLFDAAGRRAADRTLTQSTGGRLEVFATLPPGLPSGLYWWVASSNGKVSRAPMILLR